MELHRTRSLLHDAPDIDRRIILKDRFFTGSSPDNSGTCVQIDYTLEAPSPHGNCYYCASPDHEDTPCPRRRADATRYAATGRQLYPPRGWTHFTCPDCGWSSHHPTGAQARLHHAEARRDCPGSPVIRNSEFQISNL